MPPASGLSDEQRARYARQLSLPEVGAEGQAKLQAASVLIVGVGGLGSPLATYLAAAGIGTLHLADFDAVEASNLHRQPLYSTADLGTPKLEAAAKRLRALNPDASLVLHPEGLHAGNARELVRSCDVVADGADNFATRYLVNDACVLEGRPDVFAAVHRFEGQLAVFAAPGGPCYRCLHPEPPAPGQIASCAEGGVLGVLPGILGALQASEVLKLLLGIGEPLSGTLLLYDALLQETRRVRVARDPACRACGDAPTLTDLVPETVACAALAELDAAGLKARLARGETFTLLDVREPDEHARERIAGSVLVPLSELEARAEDLDPGADYVVYCRSGARSRDACVRLQARGFRRLANLSGGMLSWGG